MPDYIWLYRINILTVCRTVDEVADRINQVLLHEIGHAMGKDTFQRSRPEFFTGNDLTDDFVSTYSSRGPTLHDHILKPDLLAPGNRVVAPIPEVAGLRTDLADRVVDCSARRCSDDYLELSGTSMASAVVAATAALMLDDDSTLSPDTIKARLMRSARKIDGDPTVVGAGVLDITAALNDDGVMTTSALSPYITHGIADDGIGRGHVNSAFHFEGFENLAGGEQNDLFLIDAADGVAGQTEGDGGVHGVLHRDRPADGRGRRRDDPPLRRHSLAVHRPRALHVVDDIADRRCAADRHDRHTFGLQVRAQALRQRAQSGPVADAFDEHHGADA